MKEYLAPSRAAITVVGLGDNGCAGLPSHAFNSIISAQVLIGAERFLAFFPQFSGIKIPLKGKISEIMDQAIEYSYEYNVCILASGDPLFYGVGSLLLKKIRDHSLINFIPSPTCVQIAFSKLKINYEEARVLSFHGKKKLGGLVTELQHYKQVAILTDPHNNANAIANYLLKYNEVHWKVYLCQNLQAVDESIQEFANMEELASYYAERVGPFDSMVGPYPLEVLILIKKKDEMIAKANTKEEELILEEGLFTKKEVRAISLDELELSAEDYCWDIGAGLGSVTIAMARQAWKGTVLAVEENNSRVAIIEKNLITSKVDNVILQVGSAPEILKSEIFKQDPQAIFVGGTGKKMEQILSYCYQRLSSGGRLVLNAVTLDSVSSAYKILKELNGQVEVTMVNVAKGIPLKEYLRYHAYNPVHVFKIKK